MYSTYQKSRCWVMDRSRILKPKFNMNERNALFFISILNLNQYKFSYGRSANPNDIEQLEIIVPINKNNDIDFEYIENFMRERERAEYKRLYDLYLK